MKQTISAILAGALLASSNMEILADANVFNAQDAAMEVSAPESGQTETLTVESTADGTDDGTDNAAAFTVNFAAPLPSYYNANKKELISQYPSTRETLSVSIDNGRWDHAIIAAVELNLLKNGYTDKYIDYSEALFNNTTLHIPNDPLGGFTGDVQTVEIDEGVDPLFVKYDLLNAIKRLNLWGGLVNEFQLPYENYTDYLKEPSQFTKFNTYFDEGIGDEFAYEASPILKSARAVNIWQYDKATNTYTQGANDDAKKAIMENGSIAAFVYGIDDTKRVPLDAEKYGYSTGFVYGNNGGIVVDYPFCINIIGWDDDFSKDNFPESIGRPEHDGAWLVRGPYSGEPGASISYFWVSYENEWLPDYCYTLDMLPEGSYDNNYQYDGSPNYLPCGHNVNANIFQAKVCPNGELLSAVNISVLGENPAVESFNYSIKVYVGLTDKTDPTSGRLAATLVGTDIPAGIYTLSLDTPVKLASEEYYAVVVETDSNDELTLDREYDFHDITLSPLYVSYVNYDCTMGTGESFYYDESTSGWVDYYDNLEKDTGEDVYSGYYRHLHKPVYTTFHQGNTCIKAFTTNIEGEETDSKIYFAGNCETSGETATIYGDLTEGITLPVCGYHRVGYHFAGWNYDGKIYQPGEHFTAPQMSRETVVFNAMWQPIQAFSNVSLRQLTYNECMTNELTMYKSSENAFFYLTWDRLEGGDELYRYDIDYIEDDLKYDYGGVVPSLSEMLLGVYIRDGIPPEGYEYDVDWSMDSFKCDEYHTFRLSAVFAATNKLGKTSEVVIKQEDYESVYAVAYAYGLPQYLYSDVFIEPQMYTGEELTPEVSLKCIKVDKSYLDLKQGVDYKVTYSDNIDAGIATAEITGLGTWTDTSSVTCNFVILEPDTELVYDVARNGFIIKDSNQLFAFLKLIKTGAADTAGCKIISTDGTNYTGEMEFAAYLANDIDLGTANLQFNGSKDDRTVTLHLDGHALYGNGVSVISTSSTKLVIEGEDGSIYLVDRDTPEWVEDTLRILGGYVTINNCAINNQNYYSNAVNIYGGYVTFNNVSIIDDQVCNCVYVSGANAVALNNCNLIAQGEDAGSALAATGCRNYWVRINGSRLECYYSEAIYADYNSFLQDLWEYWLRYGFPNDEAFILCTVQVSCNSKILGYTKKTTDEEHVYDVCPAIDNYAWLLIEDGYIEGYNYGINTAGETQDYLAVKGGVIKARCNEQTLNASAGLRIASRTNKYYLYGGVFAGAGGENSYGIVCHYSASWEEHHRYDRYYEDLTFGDGCELYCLDENGTPQKMEVDPYTKEFPGTVFIKNSSFDGTGSTKVNYILDGGTNHKNNPSEYQFGNGEIILEAPTRDGYKFIGWYDNAFFAGTPVVSLNRLIFSEVTLYAKWEPITYTIKFNANGGKGTMTDQKLEYGSQTPLSSNIFKKDDCDFSGWSTGKNPSGSMALIADGATDLTLSKKDGDVVTLYAQWKPAQYKINYHFNDGLDHAADLKILKDSYTSSDADYRVPSPELIPEGHTFMGWYADAEMKNAFDIIKSGSKTDIDLYAKWKTNQYTIEFDGNGDAYGISVTGATKSVSANYGVVSKLTANGFKADGYVFAGWSLTPGADTAVYSDKANVYFTVNRAKELLSRTGNSGSVDNNSGVIRLYAQWKNIFQVTLKTNGGTLTDTSVFHSAGDGVYNAFYRCGNTLKLPGAALITRKGYSFAGWYTDTAYKKKATNISKRTAADLVLHAKWKENTYKIVFDKNGGNTGKPANMKLSYSDFATTALPKNTFVKYGKSFVAWNTAKDGSGITIPDGAPAQTMIDAGLLDHLKNNGTIRLYAVWSKQSVPYAITYHCNGGSLATTDEVPKSYEYGITQSLPVPVRSGYTFAGWYTDASLKKALKSITTKTNGNLELYAKWSRNYVIMYHYDDTDSVTPISQTAKYENATTLRANSYAKDGYGFGGWAISAENAADKIATYTDREKVLRPEEIGNDGILNLYAVFDKTFTITLDSNGGNAITENVKNYQYGIGLTNDEIKQWGTPTRSGYLFDGWYLDRSCKKAVEAILPDDAGNKVFYAKWKPATYTISFEKNLPAGDTLSGTQKATFGNVLKLKKNTCKVAGYTFVGWGKNSTAIVPLYSDGQKINPSTYPKNGILKLYAIWKETPYTITYKSTVAGLENELTALGNPTEYTVNSEDIILNAPTCEGYSFAGWYLDKGCKKRITTVPKGSSQNLTLYAKFVQMR